MLQNITYREHKVFHMLPPSNQHNNQYKLEGQRSHYSDLENYSLVLQDSREFYNQLLNTTNGKVCRSIHDGDDAYFV